MGYVSFREGNIPFTPVFFPAWVRLAAVCTSSTDVAKIMGRCRRFSTMVFSTSQVIRPSELARLPRTMISACQGDVKKPGIHGLANPQIIGHSMDVERISTLQQKFWPNYHINISPTYILLKFKGISLAKPPYGGNRSGEVAISFDQPNCK